MCDLSQGHLCGLRLLCISSGTVMHIGTDITDSILTFNHSEVDGILQKKQKTWNQKHAVSSPSQHTNTVRKHPGLISHRPL